MFTAPFWRDAIERSISTAAQALLSVWGAGTLFNLLTVDWAAAAGIASGAAALSILKALIAAQVGDRQSASLLPATGRHASPE